MSLELEVNPQLEERMRAIAREEVAKQLFGVREGWSHEKMVAAMQRIVERRKRIALPPEVVDEIIEEHRREMGRGPLVDDEE